ncbi:flagellar hook protein FlgE [Vibrio sp. HA2012]|uniref:flagellar hook protein FlgE n=1 Tax=Vibrio sp. HA2012 TaxID=1971595 RepID=UPI000C2CA132|nr:flagellar hook protein FlgE [Vibrio sp. HA2012]PJC86414.1 flagellar hook protein FlgE [Vibrio sp. HA2012]
MSFDIALTGLDATNSQINTISNNIANSSTTGFKKSRTEFAAVYNGMQAGGVEVASISQNFDENGSVSTTGRSLDLAINGSGFFVTRDSSGQTLYTRSGVFGTDKDNNIISNTGLKLQGYAATADGSALYTGSVGDLSISTASLAADATNRLDFIANFDSRATEIDTAVTPFDPTDTDSFNSSYTSKVYDSLGNPHTVTQYFTKTAANNWEVNIQVDGGSTVATETVTFDTDGSLLTPAGSFTIGFPAAGANAMSIDISLTGSTQFGSDFNVSTNSPNGYTSGELTGIRIEDNGMVYAAYSNGESLLQGQVVLADFANSQGLVKSNGTAWMQSYSSGEPIINSPGSGTLGDLSAGALEGSNVDLSSELVGLMTAQRNYQANAKTISTADQLMQALFNAV